MIIKKIIQIETPAEGQKNCKDGLYYVHYEELPDRVAMFKKEFDLAQYIDKLLREGVDANIIERLITLTIDFQNEERDADLDDVDW